MSDKSCLCLWCGRFTELKAPDGLADCDRPDCIEKRVYEDEFDKAGSFRCWVHGGYARTTISDCSKRTLSEHFANITCGYVPHFHRTTK